MLHEGAIVGRRTGASTTEILLVLPIVIVLVLGLVEMGALAWDSHALDQAARAGMECAAVGGASSQIDTYVDANCSHLDANRILRLYEYRGHSASSEDWDDWSALGVSGGLNDALPGNEVSVNLRYPHGLLMGRLFSSFVPHAADGTVLVESQLTALRR